MLPSLKPADFSFTLADVILKDFSPLAVSLRDSDWPTIYLFDVVFTDNTSSG